jgi:hypothetical protein
MDSQFWMQPNTIFIFFGILMLSKDTIVNWKKWNLQ